ncbi:MAG TPA: hypothetical protein VLH35_03730 [Candidatus Acidoferrales bacterium]|nr:hypothetical protein [Candidatus Acidoferrales bacterium]
MISVPVITLYAIHAYRQQIVQQMIDEEIENQPKRVYTKYVPVFLEDNRIYQGSDKPYIIISDFSARDYRGNPPYSLQISGKGINDGGGIAYNGSLHVVAVNNESVVIDTYYDFGGATPHVSFGFSFSLKYNSTSPITNCTITPFYTDVNG